MVMVEAQIYYPRHTSIWENVASVTDPNDCPDHRSKVFTTGQDRGNPKHYVIKCVGSRYALHYSYGILTLAVCCS